MKLFPACSTSPWFAAREEPGRPQAPGRTRRLLGVARIVLAVVVVGPVFANVADDDARLPDGSVFPFWKPATAYSRTYFVDQDSAAAADSNPGTEEQPFRTINQAAKVLVPGERVWVKSGVYREWVQPARGGSDPGKMISYEAAPGAKVVIKGSRVVSARWERSLHPVEFSDNLWMVPLPEGASPDYNPFLRANASPEEFRLMPWGADYAGLPPYTLSRGLIFQDGRRLLQLSAYGDLLSVPGTFWVDAEKKILHVHPFENKDPNQCVVEYTAQHFLFKAPEKGRAYIQVKGLRFIHAGNGLPRTGEGALSTNGGHHWVFVDNLVEQINSVGLELGGRTLETENAAEDEEDGRRAEASPGNHIVRHNRFRECGRNGVQGYVVRHALVEDNTIHDCGWLDVERYYEAGGIKLLSNVGTLIRRNRIARITGAPAIWLDWDNRNCRITRNVVSDTASSCNGSVFIEASRHPNTIDHNILWRIRGTGIFAGDTDQLLIAHNLIGDCSGPPVRLQKVTDRTLDGRVMSSRQHRVENNLFVGGEVPRILEAENFCDHNTYLSPRPAPALAAWKASGWDAHGDMLEGSGEFDEKSGALSLVVNGDSHLPMVPRIRQCYEDFFGAPRSGSTTGVGPFAETAPGRRFLYSVDLGGEFADE